MPRLPSPGVSSPTAGVGRTDILLKRAHQASEAGRLEEAVQHCRRIIAIDPTDAAVRNLLGMALGKLGEISAAIEQFDNSLRLDPDQAVVWHNRGIALSRIGHVPEAIACFDRMIALRPDELSGYVMRAAALYFIGRFEDAVAAYEKLILIEPNDLLLVTSLGVSLEWCGRFDEAAAIFDRAIAVDANCATAWASKAFMLMLLGDLRRGLPMFEWRWGMMPANHKRPMPEPPWLGDTDIAGRTLFLYWEQGLGDTIQFCRYASIAARAGARVILEVQRPLVELLATLDGVDELRVAGDPTPEYDLHCPLMSLPLAFSTTFETIPATVPYLHADPTEAAKWRDALTGLRGRRIGLVWAGSTNIGKAEVLSRDQRRSLPLATFAPLASLAGCGFVSLQVGEPSREAARPPAGMTLYDNTEALRTFADTAALIANLDLVISVDTATAHLAGAMGKPVWLLNRFDTDWRWMLDRDDSPWYPTMQIFRQPKPGDWASVAQMVAQELGTISLSAPHCGVG
jgi:Flp pilus assembly protein TadD